MPFNECSPIVLVACKILLFLVVNFALINTLWLLMGFVFIPN